MNNVISWISNVVADVVANPGAYALIALWLVVSWISSRENGKSFLGMLFKSFFFFLGLVVFHDIAPVIFWIVVGLTIAISVFLAIKGG